ncbi:MAG: SDR family oxidoreductase [Solirubrobacterales bacterium]|nr:SDR family oxidoreductase [Solirubrobacterales bacterium]
MSLPKPTSSTAALVTGASAGIGSEIARLLAQRGHTLVLVARRKDRLTALADELSEEYGVRVETIAADLGKPTPRGKIPGRIEELGLQIEILINNAGFATGGEPFHEAEPDRELEQVRVDVEAVVALTSAFLPGMVKRGRGAILNVASTAGMQPIPYSAGYAAAKAYVLSFSEAIHQEVRGHGVTVTALAPGPVETDFWQIAGWETSSGKSFERAVPGTLISPAQAASAAVEGLDRGERVVVPGLPIRAAMLASRYIPHMLKLPALERFMRPGGNPENLD